MSPIKLRIKKKDQVVIIAGKDKGKKGEVIEVKRLPNGVSKVKVSGCGLVKKHTRANPQANQPGGIQEQEAFISISNVMLLNPIENKGSRVGFRVLENGKKARYYKSTGENIDAE